MSLRRILEYGGLLAGVVLIAFGIGALYMGIDGRTTVRDSIAAEGIVFGDKTDPAVEKYASQWAGQEVKTGDQARAFAKVMREHTLESTGGLTYAAMGRFQSAKTPTDPKGTNDAALAANGSDGQPVANGARNTWVTETALTTALNMSYMAEQLSIFGIVVGIALLLAGVGFLILALAVLGGRLREESPAVTGIKTTTPAASH